MRNTEFGLDTGESLNDELQAARSLIDGQALDRDAHYLKIPVTFQRLITTTEFFIQVMSSQKPELAARLFKLDGVRKCAYGLDSVALVKTHPGMGVALNDYESYLTKNNLNGEMFTVFDIEKNNYANSLLIVNNMAAKSITQFYPEDFDDLVRSDPIKFIERSIVDPLRKGRTPTADMQFGLLSGFPRESVRLYPAFDELRKRLPKFANIYRQFLNDEIQANEVYRVIKGLNIPEPEKKFLLKILADQARFNDRAAITAGGFIMFKGEDLHYAQRREQWFRYLDNVYKPIVRSTSYL